MEKNRDVEHILGLIHLNMREIGMIIKSVDMENIPGQMVDSI